MFSDSVCKKRWKGIRHSYISGYRRRLSRDPSSATSCLNWHFWPKLQFLNVCLDPSKYNLSAEALVEDETSDATQFPNSEECYEESNGIIEVTPGTGKTSPLIADPIPETQPTTTTKQTKQPKPKTTAKKKNIIESYHSNDERCQVQDDTVDVFFKSMAMSVKKLPAHLIIKARMDICKLVSQYELEAIELPRTSPRRRKAKATKRKVKREVFTSNDSSDDDH